MICQTGGNDNCEACHDHKPLRDAEANGHSDAARALREAGSYDPFRPGDFERAAAERVARDYCANGGTGSFEEVRDRVLRMFGGRHASDRPPQP